jgi:hypothetical protein
MKLSRQMTDIVITQVSDRGGVQGAYRLSGSSALIYCTSVGDSIMTLYATAEPYMRKQPLQFQRQCDDLLSIFQPMCEQIDRRVRFGHENE